MISIIVPAYNEEANIIRLVTRIENTLSDKFYEVIFVDDGSTDATSSEIEEAQKLFPHRLISHVRHTENKGIAESWFSGVLIAKFEIVALIDCDLQNPPEFLNEMLNIFQREPVDIVQGYRSEVDRIKDLRFVLSRGLDFILNVIFRVHLKDAKSGFLLGSKYAIQDALILRKDFRYFQTFIAVALHRKGYLIRQVETLFPKRELGESFMNGFTLVKVVALVILDIVRAIRVLPKKDSYIFGTFTEPVRLVARNRMFEYLFHFYFKTMPLHAWLLTSRTRALYQFLKSMEFIDVANLKKFQEKRFRDLIKHAYHNVPFYKERMMVNNLEPRDISSISDLHCLPVTYKKDLREQTLSKLLSENHDKSSMHRIKTSGSTGEPLVVYADKFQLEMRFAHTLRALEMTGWKFGFRQMRLWHQTIGMTTSQIVRERLDALMMRRKFIPAFELTQNSIDKFSRKLTSFRPFLLDGYAESLNFISVAIGQGSLKISPHAVMSSAQQLTESTRLNIEKSFDCKVFDKYGSREFSGIAYQCDKSPYHHVQSESYIVEIIHNGRHARPGEIGEVLVTDLNNYSMPLIRYAIGDLARAVEQKPCPCGRPHELIGEIIGRTQALVACSNGVWLPGTFFAHFFKDFDNEVRHYQIVQESDFSINVLVVPNSGWHKQSQSKILSKLQLFMGKENKIIFTLVDEIPLLQTGKRTPVISKVNYIFSEIDSKSIRTVN